MALPQEDLRLVPQSSSHSIPSWLQIDDSWVSCSFGRTEQGLDRRQKRLRRAVGRLRMQRRLVSWGEGNRDGQLLVKRRVWQRSGPHCLKRSDG
jgi:hypothetical protein